MCECNSCFLKFFFLLILSLCGSCCKQRVLKFRRIKHDAMVLDTLGGVQADIVCGEVHLTCATVCNESINIIILLHFSQSRCVHRYNLCIDIDGRQDCLECGSRIVILRLAVNLSVKSIRISCLCKHRFCEIYVVLIELGSLFVCPGVRCCE